ncbi:hypothetical protein C8R45DRAFT_378831 [Mycena sanguinolenta]|nr:hypothetical protein C8R45DRAFT_378831 [Mycena sanguinolenta]
MPMASASSVLHRVPPEVVCEIFALSLCPEAGQDEDAFGKKPPWQLGHICQSWRFAALGYPPLWNVITIPPHDSEQLWAMIEIQLLRSANGALDVYWQAGCPLAPDASTHSKN